MLLVWITASLVLAPGARAQNTTSSSPAITIELPPETVTEAVKLFRQALSIAVAGADNDKLCGPVDTIVFFEETGCLQNTVGSLALPSVSNAVNVKDDLDCFDNDEADALMLTAGFPCGGKLVVCDNPWDCLADDKATIYLKKPLGPNQVYCVRTFQNNFEDDFVKVVFDNINGLNGKVSRVEIFTSDPLNGQEHGVVFQCRR